MNRNGLGMRTLDKSQSHAVRRIAAVCLAVGCLATTFVAVAEADGQMNSKVAILARTTLMNSIEDYVNRINRMISIREINLRDAHEYADNVSVMLMGFPHLFPPSSNQWKEDAEREDPVTDTMASPDIWLRYPQFYEMAATASKT